MREVISYYGPAIRAATVLETLGLQAGRYFVVSAHREENVDVPERFARLVAAMNSLAADYDMPVVFSVHPRTRQRLAAAPDLRLDQRVRSLKPLGFLDYAQLQKESFCTISDSGTVTEEAALLGFAAVTIRQAHERPEGMDEGTLVMSDLDDSSFRRAVRTVTDHKWRDGAVFRCPPDYQVDDVSKKVLRLMLSYVDYVRRTVWSGQHSVC
jgi:UDP-N-acetylglucosamine 2-epimerase (non-hydrolysing)